MVLNKCRVSFLKLLLAKNFYLPNLRKFGQKTIPEVDDLLNLNELEYIKNNAALRKVDVNITRIESLLNKIRDTNNNNEYMLLMNDLKYELWKLPNQTHPEIIEYDKPKELCVFNEFKKMNFEPLSFKNLTKTLNLLRTEHLGNFNGHKSYYLSGILAELECALTQYTLNKLKKHGFKIMAVPDILPANIIEGCGMQTEGERTQVYKLEGSRKCLSGTSEMALAGYFSNEIIEKEKLPIKVAAVSRCFRAETSGLKEEKGIYRVHQFTKVEMFSVSDENQSDRILEQFRNIQTEMFGALGLYFKVLDMPPSDLGNPAYRKYDIEAWMPGAQMWGEISSCSNCTDYQARRLNIKIKNNNNLTHFAHTINGTACAVPRMLIALLETFQTKKGRIDIPNELHPYLTVKEITKNSKLLHELKLVKTISL